MGIIHYIISFFGSFFAHGIDMMGFLGAGNNPMVGMTVAIAVAVS